MTDTAALRPQNRTAYPVFNGLTELRVSDADLAEALNATLADVVAWRDGIVRMPGRVVAFLTLVLDALVDRKSVERVYVWPLMGGGGAVPETNLIRARDSLQQQQAFNLALARHDLNDGLRLFRSWCARKVAGSQAHDLAERLFLHGMDRSGAIA